MGGRFSVSIFIRTLSKFVDSVEKLWHVFFKPQRIPQSMTKFIYVFTLMFCAMGNTFAHALENECGSYAEIDGTSYVLSPSGGDDTSTIQCALDSAISQGMPTVRLDRGTFYTNELRTSGFNGSFTGTTRRDSRLLINNSIADCSASTLPIIAFLGGNVAVKSMTIDADEPCSGEGDFIVLYFTPESCSKRTLFALVDRVDIGYGGTMSFPKGVQMTGSVECLDQGKGPLGTLKVNRSSFTNFFVGVHTALYGAAQVDINFNEFNHVSIGTLVTDASQSTTITGNTFDYISAGVMALAGTSYSAAKNRTVVDNNTFNQLYPDPAAQAITIANEYKLVNHSSVITNNTLNLSRDGSRGNYQFGISLADIDGALISGNTFRGSAVRAIEIGSLNFSDYSDNNAILGNIFSLSTSDVDIFVGNGSRNTVIGSQGASYTNLGINTLVGG